MRIRLPERSSALLWRNLVAAFAVLLPFKAALVLNNVFGTEGFESGPSIAAKSLLFFGNDLLGALLVAALASALSWPLVALGRARLGHSAAITLQALHGALVAVSFFATLYVGGPLNREVIELSALASDANAEAGAGAPAMWSSVARYLGPLQIAAVLAGVALPIVAYVLQPRLAARLGRRAKRVLLWAAAIEAALTALLLPWLINGHVLGIRIHTYGLERSAGLELARSYVKPLFAGLGSRGVAPADPFVFDFSPIEPSGYPTAPNPLRGAVPKRTNVILVSMESVGAPYSDSDPEVMPFVRGARSRPGSVYLAHHYTVWPQTMKAFFSVFCSELPYPYYQSITAVNPAIPCVSLSEALHARGYATAFITSADFAYDRKMRFFQHRAFDYAVDMKSMPGREGAWGDSWGIEETVAVRHILDYAARHRDRPFFVFYEMFTAHHPYNACAEHEKHPLEERPAYLRALRYIDDRVRELWEGLTRLGLADDTLLVAFGDHGEGFGQHPEGMSHGPKVYEEIARVPLLIEGPQLAGVAGELELPTSHVDLAPTILGLLGLDAPCTMKGRDLSATDQRRLVLFGGRPPGAQRGVVDGRWKYIEEEDGPQMLFDLDEDPGERVNRIAGREAQAGRYRARLDAWRAFSENLIENYASVLRESGCRPGGAAGPAGGGRR
jgi:lipoteichoic acid synthase